MTPTPPLPFTRWTGLAGRVVLGLVFALAGFLKAAAPAEEFAYAMETYKVFPAWLATLASLTVPWAEIYLGLFLAAGLFTRASAALIGGMMLFFQALLAQAMVRGLPITNCGCFGALMNNPIEVEFALNFVLLGAAALAWRHGRDRFSLDGAIESLAAPAPSKEKR